MAAAAAIGAPFGRAFQHTRPNALPRHFKQAEMRYATDLNARTIVPKAFLEPTLNRAIVALLIHIDEVNDNETGKVSQPQLPRDFVGRFQIGFERGVLDMMLARSPAGIDVDCDQ